MAGAKKLGGYFDLSRDWCELYCKSALNTFICNISIIDTGFEQASSYATIRIVTKSSSSYVTFIILIYRCICLSDIVVLSANRKTGHLTRSTAEKGDDTFSLRDHLSDKDAPESPFPPSILIKPPISYHSVVVALQIFCSKKQSSPKTVKAAWLLIYIVVSHETEFSYTGSQW